MVGLLFPHFPKPQNLSDIFDIYDMFKGNTRKELLNFLEEFKKYTPETFIPSECIPVEKEEILEEDQESSEIEYQQMPMMNRWMDDGVGQ